LEQSTAILEQSIILVNFIFYTETFEEDFMHSIKGWIIPIIMLIVLITVIGVGIYQLNSEKNPWDFRESNTFKSWSFLSEEN
jgi:hypothetical protein